MRRALFIALLGVAVPLAACSAGEPATTSADRGNRVAEARPDDSMPSASKPIPSTDPEPTSLSPALSPTVEGSSSSDSGQPRTPIPAAAPTASSAPQTIALASSTTQTSILGVASNRVPVTAPNLSDNAARDEKKVAAVSFVVPPGHSYQILVAAQAWTTATSGGACAGRISKPSGSLNVYLDASQNFSLIGFTSAALPGGGMGGSQAVVVGAGRHSVSIVNMPNQCTPVTDPGSVTVSAAYLSVNLLGAF